MNRLTATWVVARRDFLALVATPTFLLFLLAPLLFVALSTLGSLSAESLVTNAGATQRVIAQVPEAEREAFVATDVRLRGMVSGLEPPRLLVLPADTVHGDALAAARRNPDVVAILTGNAARPVIAERDGGRAGGRYLALLADSVARAGTEGAGAEGVSTPVRERLGGASGSGRAGQAGLAYGAVFITFLLILMLGGQTVGTLAEEKGNKVIEILAAAIPMESVFYGKLIGMLGVALLFIGFWGAVVGIGGSFVISQFAGADGLSSVATTPAVGWPLFLLLALAYFLMGFMLLGAVFLGLGALASSVREIQMLSLPITLFQVGMFTLGSIAANTPGSTAAVVAQWLPWSSPYAMVAQAATSPTLWPHLVALGWQALWLSISVAIAVRLFRAGVLRSGPLIPWLNRRPAPAIETD
jgi:ABC-2 type transport system permease protein